MWIVAAIALGTVWRWAFAFVILKPTFIVLALLGLRHRSWWIAIGLIVAVSLVFGRLWLDWIAVATNSGVSLAYNLPTVPLIVAPLIPWLASNWRRGDHQGPASDGGLAAEPS